MYRKAMENIKNMEKLHIEDGHMESTVNKFLEVHVIYITVSYFANLSNKLILKRFQQFKISISQILGSL